MFLKTRLQESSKTFVFFKEKRFRRRTRRIKFRFRRDPKLFPRRSQFGSEPFVFLQKMIILHDKYAVASIFRKAFLDIIADRKMKNQLEKQYVFRSKAPRTYSEIFAWCFQSIFRKALFFFNNSIYFVRYTQWKLQKYCFLKENEPFLLFKVTSGRLQNASKNNGFPLKKNDFD